jgi:hypothetical protein
MHAPITPSQLDSVAGEFPQVLLTGRELLKFLRSSTPTDKALLAGDMIAGDAVVHHPTAAQARKLTGASYGYTNAARTLSPLERAAAKAKRLKLGDVMRRPQPMSDSKLDKLVARIGLARVWDSLDRLTR